MTRELMERDSYNDVTYSIYRDDDHKNVRGERFAEFVLEIGGEPVTNASTLELQGWEFPWIPAMEKFAKAYIDGAVETGGLEHLV